MAIRRRSRFAERIGKMQGLPPQEQDLLRRIGEVVDGGLNNRGPANPALEGRRRLVRSPILPPPRGLTVTASDKIAVIDWRAVDSPILLFYEVQITNVETNFIQNKVSFTNRLFFGDAGTYLVRVRSVGRNGDVSPFSSEQVRFNISQEVLFLEGNKVGAQEVIEQMSEDIFTPLDYTVFSWGAFNKAGFVDANQASVPLMFLGANTFYPSFSDLALFRETELFANVDDNSILNVVRPGDDPRSSFFITPFSAMFKPLSITLEDPFTLPLINTAPVFNMTVNNPQEDSASTSLTLFSIPGATKVVEEEPLNLKSSIELFEGTSGNSSPIQFNASTFRGATLGVSNKFTIGMWIKYFNFPFTFTLSIHDMSIYGRIPPTDGTAFGKRDDAVYQIKLGLATPKAGSVRFFSGGENGENAELSLVAPTLQAFTNADTDRAFFNLQNDFAGPIFAGQGNGFEENLFINRNGNWVFLAATFDSSAPTIRQWVSFSGFGTHAVLGQALKQNFFFSGRKLVHRIQLAGPGVDGVGGSILPLEVSVPFRKSDNFLLDPRFRFLRITGYSFKPDNAGLLPMRLHWLAVWDGLLAGELDPKTLKELPNQLEVLAANPEHDLRTPLKEYTKNGSLAHWWVFGRNPNPVTKSEIVEDLGLSVPVPITRDSSLTLTQAKNTLVNDRPTEFSGTGPGVGEDS